MQPNPEPTHQPSGWNEPIAIVGIGCRFPGGVHDLESFWQLLRNGVDAIEEIPASRFDLTTYYDPRPATPGKVMTRFGGFLEPIDSMDAAFFGISPREAERIDPQQRILMEVAWEALENAGIPVEALLGSQTGVFVGQWLSDFEARLFADPAKTDFYMTTGSGRYTSSGRLSYLFGLQGPSLTLDTACSSSLVAVHTACQSLRSGESEVALAAAVNVILQPHITIAYSQSRMMAPDGRCKFGDARANGYVRSEGGAALVLKRLSDAQRDGDPIHALIIGSAVNNDGQSSGFLTTPGGAGQEEMLRKAYQNARVAPGSVQYVEAHGTGTAAGDPVEIGALGAVLGDGRPTGRPCHVGSVKTNFGHTESAAGLAGLIKVVLSLKHAQLPPSLHFETPNPSIAWDRLPLRIHDRLSNWPEHDGPALAGVSAFGIAGTNAHIVLQEAPAALSDAPVETRRQIILPLSARSPEALQALAGQVAGFLEQQPAVRLSDVLYTAGQRRSHHGQCLAVTANDRAGLIEALDGYAQGDSPAGIMSGQAQDTPRIVFVFPGQGAQWLGMGRQLYEAEPAFRAAIERCEQAFRPFVDWSLTGQLFAGEAESRLAEIDVVQPTLFAIEVALAETWRSWGVEPDAVVGHSMGEPAAAYIAGALSLEDAARVICTRSRLMKRVSGKGAMAVVELTLEQAQAALAGMEDRLSIAVSNGPRATVLSGDPAALESVTARLQAQGVFVRAVKVDVAAHSPHMDALRTELVDALAGIQPRSPEIPIYSTVTGALADFALDAVYWGRNLRQPVLFAAAVEQISAAGRTIFIECSPHPTLLGAIEQGSAEGGRLTVASMRRAEDELGGLRSGLSRVYAHGGGVHWERLYPSGEVVALPTYPWQRERYWASEAELGSAPVPRATRLLQERFETPAQPDVTIWQTAISLERFAYLGDHRVNGAALLPAAAFAELALEAAAALELPAAIEHLELTEALALQPVTSVILQVIASSARKFEIVSRAEGSTEWTRHASGRFAEAAPVEAFADLVARPPEEAHTGAQHLGAMRARGLEYGPAFQAVSAFTRTDQALAGWVRLPAALSPGEHVIHPALLDGCLQLLVGTLEEGEAAGDAFLPVKIGRLQVTGRVRADASLSVWAERHPDTSPDLLRGDIHVQDEHGQVVLVARGVEMRRLRAASAARLEELLYQVNWQPVEGAAPPTATPGEWLIASPDVTLAQRLSEVLQRQGAQAARVLDLSQSGGLAGALDAQPGAIVYLAATPPQETPAAAEAGAASLLALLQAAAGVDWKTPPRVWLVTQGAQAVLPGESVSPALAALWGLAASAAHEFPAWGITRVDVDTLEEPGALARVLRATPTDPLALRAGKRFTAQLARAAWDSAAEAVQPTPAAGRAFHLEVAQPGLMDSLALRAFARPQPAPGEVEIEVQAAGVNFIDVLKAHGIYPGMDRNSAPALGLECAGIIRAVGDPAAAPHLRVGQAVLAFARRSFASHALADARLTWPLPAGITMAEAASLPVVYLTAYYALVHLGRMQPGERVLIHSAAGGVGLAAVQLAQHTGAEVFATAGSEERRALLRELGVQHVMDSRSLDFAEQIMAITAGRGVDLVLNSLTGEAIARSLAVLAPYGRFLEIGKRDIYANNSLGLSPFKNGLAYFAIDIDRMATERPALLDEMMRAVLALIEQGALRPLPVTVFRASEAGEAFRRIAQPNHSGKIVLDFGEQDVDILPTVADSAPIKPDAAYLITGGLGALGLASAARLADEGARHLALVGRGGERGLTESGRETIAALRARGVTVHVLAADVAEAEQAARVIAFVREKMPPLRGVIHAAGVLDDGILVQQSAARIHTTFAPKAGGAWNLHCLTLDVPLDFFILYSSVAAPFGSPGQSNYAAANAWLDGLAHLRRAAGLPALSINWGPWSQIGLAAQRKEDGTQGLGGLSAVSPQENLDVLGRLLAHPAAQVIVTRLNAATWVEAHPAAARSSLFAGLAGQASSSTKGSALSLRARLLAAAPGRARHALLEGFIQEQAAQVLRMPPARVELNKPLRSLGMDSLMGIEFRNRLESGLEVALSATLIWNYPTVHDLTPFLAEKIGVPVEAAAPETPPVADTLSASGEDLDALSDAEISAMLDDELKSLDDLL